MILQGPYNELAQMLSFPISKTLYTLTKKRILFVEFSSLCNYESNFLCLAKVFFYIKVKYVNQFIQTIFTCLLIDKKKTMAKHFLIDPGIILKAETFSAANKVSHLYGKNT